MEIRNEKITNTYEEFQKPFTIQHKRSNTIFGDTLEPLHDARPSFLYRSYTAVKDPIVKFLSVLWDFIWHLFSTPKLKGSGSGQGGFPSSTGVSTSNGADPSKTVSISYKIDGKTLHLEDFNVPSGVSSDTEQQKKECLESIVNSKGITLIQVKDFKLAEDLYKWGYETNFEFNYPTNNKPVNSAISKMVNHARGKKELQEKEKQALENLKEVKPPEKFAKVRESRIGSIINIQSSQQPISIKLIDLLTIAHFAKDKNRDSISLENLNPEGVKFEKGRK